MNTINNVGVRGVFFLQEASDALYLKSAVRQVHVEHLGEYGEKENVSLMQLTVSCL